LASPIKPFIVLLDLFIYYFRLLLDYDGLQASSPPLPRQPQELSPKEGPGPERRGTPSRVPPGASVGAASEGRWVRREPAGARVSRMVPRTRRLSGAGADRGDCTEGFDQWRHQSYSQMKCHIYCTHTFHSTATDESGLWILGVFFAGKSYSKFDGKRPLTITFQLRDLISLLGRCTRKNIWVQGN